MTNDIKLKQENTMKGRTLPKEEKQIGNVLKKGISDSFSTTVFHTIEQTDRLFKANNPSLPFILTKKNPATN